MNPEVLKRISDAVASYRTWCQDRQFQNCRLVQYCGPDMIGAIDVPVAQIEAQIEGLLAEGFDVDWGSNGNQLYLRVWEFGGAEPDWQSVYAERSLQNA